MKVKELIKQLKSIDGEIEVYLQKDEEGNGYTQLRCVDDQCVLIRDDYDAEIYSRTWTADEACLDEDEWEMMKRDETRFCVVLSP